MKKYILLALALVLPAFAANQQFSLDAYAEKAEKVAQDIPKEINWSSLKSKEELYLEYITNKDRTDSLKLFYCTKQIVQKKEDIVPDVAKLLLLTENEDRFASIALPLLYTRDRRVVEPLKKIIEDKGKSMKERGLCAAILATYAKSETYAKEKWKIAKLAVYTSEFNRLENEDIKALLDYVDELKFREDIGVDIFLWVKPGIFDFVQPVETEEALKEKERKEKKEALLKDLKSDKKDKRENAIYAMLNFPFPGRGKLLEGVSKTDSDPNVRKSAKLYLKLLDRVKQEKTVPVVTEEKKK